MQSTICIAEGIHLDGLPLHGQLWQETTPYSLTYLLVCYDRLTFLGMVLAVLFAFLYHRNPLTSKHGDSMHLNWDDRQWPFVCRTQLVYLKHNWCTYYLSVLTITQIIAESWTVPVSLWVTYYGIVVFVAHIHQEEKKNVMGMTVEKRRRWWKQTDKYLIKIFWLTSAGDHTALEHNQSCMHQCSCACWEDTWQAPLASMSRVALTYLIAHKALLQW